MGTEAPSEASVLPETSTAQFAEAGQTESGEVRIRGKAAGGAREVRPKPHESPELVQVQPVPTSDIGYAIRLSAYWFEEDDIEPVDEYMMRFHGEDEASDERLMDDARVKAWFDEVHHEALPRAQ